MSGSFGLALYLTLTSFGEKPALPGQWNTRPNGPVIWIWCNSANDLAVARTVSGQFKAEDEEATFLITFPSTEGLEPASNEIFLSLPKPGRLLLRSFLDHWMPDVLLWVRGGLDPRALVETDTLGIERILIDAQADAIRPGRGGWIPRLIRPLVTKLDRVFAADEAAKEAAVRATYPADQVEILGPFRDAISILPYSEVSRARLSAALATRPVWCALDVSLEKAPVIAAAHRKVSRRAHRLVLLVAPDAKTNPNQLSEALREAGFDTLLQSESTEPTNATQIVVAQNADEPGLWIRLSPVTFLCGTLDTEPSRHPFEVASLGSALIHGPKTTGYEDAFEQLRSADASVQIQSGDDLAAALDELLAADRSAEITVAAWDVTSKSAAVTTRVAETVRRALEKAGY